MKFRHRFTIALLVWSALCAFGVIAARAQSCVLTDKPIRYESGVVGKHLYIPCEDGRTTGLSCTHAACDPSKFGGVVTGIINSADQASALKTAWNAHIKWNCDAPPDAVAAALCKERADIIKPAVYRVKNNGVTATRPAFALINGVVVQKEAGRATVGTVCDLTKPTYPAMGSDVRAEFGTAGLVTICAKGIL